MDVSHRKTEAQPGTVESFGEFDLQEEACNLVRRAAEGGGEAVSLVQEADLQVTLRRLDAGSCIPWHEAPGRITVQTIAGHIRMHAAGREFDLPQGHLLTLGPSVRHDVQAVVDSAFLITRAAPPGGKKR